MSNPQTVSNNHQSIQLAITVSQEVADRIWAFIGTGYYNDESDVIDAAVKYFPLPADEADLLKRCCAMTGIRLEDLEELGDELDVPFGDPLH